MEFSQRALNAQRALTALIIIAALGVAWVERGSALAKSARENRVWLAWLAARTEGRVALPALLLVRYDPLRRSAVLLHVPEDARIAGRRTLRAAYLEALSATGDDRAAARGAEELAKIHLDSLSLEPLPWASAGRLELRLPPLAENGELELAAARALKDETSPGAWLRRLRAAGFGLMHGRRDASDQLLFALELLRVPRESLNPAVLPSGPDAPALLARILGRREPGYDDERAVVAEVLNAAGEPGLASRAAKMLRSRGVDVVTQATAPRMRARTVVYDRIGDFSRAERVRLALGCASAATTTRADALRGVDASVVLGADCVDSVPAAGKRL